MGLSKIPPSFKYSVNGPLKTLITMSYDDGVTGPFSHAQVTPDWTLVESDPFNLISQDGITNHIHSAEMRSELNPDELLLFNTTS